MDLRDRFAAHFAAALVDAFADAGQVARRAYDLAEAMMLERARRVDAEEGDAIALEPRHASIPPADEWLAPAPSTAHGALLDEPEPMFEPDLASEEDLDPRWLEPPYDPSWDLETRWSPDVSPPASAPAAASARTAGPGLVRTQPEPGETPQDELGRERSA